MSSHPSMVACRSILNSSGSSFQSVFRLLPSGERDALTAFYAFCRLVDDEVDEASDEQSARTSVTSWYERVEDVYRGVPRGPVCEALGWAADRFDLRREHLELVLSGVEQDLGDRRFEKFSDLYDYCYRVASAVGFVCITVLGETSPEVELYAELTGIGVQLTNILRDVGEDAMSGRIYLPLEDLRAFGVREKEVLTLRMTPAMRQLLRFEASRARHFYDLAGAALPPEVKRRLFFTEALRETYSRLLERLVEADLSVFNNRVSLRKLEKISIALKHRLRPRTLLGAAR